MEVQLETIAKETLSALQARRKRNENMPVSLAIVGYMNNHLRMGGLIDGDSEKAIGAFDRLLTSYRKELEELGYRFLTDKCLLPSTPHADFYWQ